MPPSPPFSPSLISLMVSVDVKHHVYLLTVKRKPMNVSPAISNNSSIPSKYFPPNTELRSDVKVEAAVLGSVPNKPTVSVDVKQHSTNPPNS